MINSLQLKNFTAFRESNLKFSSGLNIIIGENSTGKTHLLKLGYLFCNTGPGSIDSPGLIKSGQSLGKQRTEEYFAKRLQGLFKPVKIGNLSNSQGDGKTVVTAEVKIVLQGADESQPEPKTVSFDMPVTWDFQFSNRSETKVSTEKENFTEITPFGYFPIRPIYLPTKEMISFFDGFKEIARKYSLQFDETFLDLADNLALPELKDKPELLKKHIQEVSRAIGGTLIQKNSRFYLKQTGQKEREITLVSEGFRKIATLLYLIDNGSLEKGGTIFWDEPEANLNPSLVKLVAKTICFLVQNGIQVVLATHSLFLLRELEILGNQQEFSTIGRRFFALEQTDNGVTIQQSDNLDEIDPIALLDESLLQSDRFLEEV